MRTAEKPIHIKTLELLRQHLTLGLDKVTMQLALKILPISNQLSPNLAAA